MINSFPYSILSKQSLIRQINYLASNHIPFLLIVDYKAESGYVIRQEELDENYVQFQFEKQQATVEPENIKQQVLQLDIQPLTQEQYQRKFDFVQQQIHQGNSFLVNLTQPTEVNCNFTLFEIFTKSKAKYRLWLKDTLLVLSPETFIRIEGQTISSFPMKGTIDADILNAEETILNDPKEKAEHATIVDLIRNDLSLVASHVKVRRYRYVEKIKTNKQDLLQVSSEISGLLPENYQNKLGDILFALLPAGSICGAPKAKTLEIIQDAEGYNRGFYTGICGYYDGTDFDSGVMIRFMEQDGERLVFKSGGGITSQSELIKEYEELIQKVYVPVC